MNKKNNPLISCLCVTQNNIKQLKRSINCFINQTYPNKELIIVYEDNNIEATLFLNAISSNEEYAEFNIKIVKISHNPKLSLGELRNISIENCNGEYFCQWDDDDWYHSDRLFIQFSAAHKNFHPASILTYWIIYDCRNNQAYLSFYRFWEGSLLCRKDIINNKTRYPPISKSEDRQLINMLLSERKIYPLVCPFLYIYTYHGKNTWHEGHFEWMFTGSQKLSIYISNMIFNILEERYTCNKSSKLLKSRKVLEEINYCYSLNQTESEYINNTLITNIL